MGKCLYTYQGKEFKTKEELAEFIKNSTTPISSYTIKGTPRESELKQAVIESEAEQQYGTSEFLSFEYTEEGLEVTVDQQAIKDLNSGEKLLENAQTGKFDSVNIQELINKERAGETIPQYKDWEFERDIFIAERIGQEYLQDLIEEQQAYTPTDMRDKLLSFAEKMGISIETMENYLKNKKIKDNAEVEDLEGLADIFSKIIALNKTGDVKILTEEVSHFAVEWFSDQSIIQKMIDKVNQTDTYKREADRYREVYKREGLSGEQLENKVRREVLGKILAEKIIDNFNEETTASLSEKGIISQLRNLWNSLLDLFNTNQNFLQEFGAILDEMAYNVLDGKESSFTARDSKEVYYAISKDKAQSNVRESLTSMSAQFRNLYRQYKQDDSLTKKGRAIKIQEAIDNLTKNEYVQTVNSLIAVADIDIQKASRLVAESRSSGKPLSEVADGSDITSVLNFTTHITPLLNSLKAEVEYIKDNRLFSANERENSDLGADLTRKLNNMTTQITGIQPELNSYVDKEVKKVGEEFLDKGGYTNEEFREGFLQDLSRNIHKRIGWWGKHAASIRDSANNFLKMANAFITRADIASRRDTVNWALSFRDIINKHDLTDSPLVTWLISNKRMRNALNLAELEKEEQASKDLITEEYDKKIEEAETQAEVERLTEEKSRALNAHDREWRVSRTNYAFDKKLDDLDISQATRNIIKSRSADKYKILKKYKNSDDTINYEAISTRDLLLLERLDANFSMQISEWNGGVKKEGQSLKIARELKKYQESFQNKEEGVDLEKFENDRQVAVKKTGVSSLEAQSIDRGAIPATRAGEMYRTWLSQNAVFNYKKEVMDTIEFGNDIEVDFETTMNKMRLDISYGIEEDLPETVINTLLDNKLRLLVEISGIELNGRQLQSEEVFNEIYNGLLQKRKELIKPYRKKDKIGEIQGDLVEENKELLDTLFELDDARRSFKTEEFKSSTKMKAEANDAFNRKLDSLKGRERRDFARRVDKKGVPLDYHYRRLVLEDSTSQKEWQPNFRYRLNNEFTENLNPDYIEELAGKAIQYNLKNEKVAKHLDNEFYEIFGIDKETDPYGLKRGATKNKGLWELREFLLNSKSEIDGEYGLSNNYFRLPQVIADRREIGTLGKNTITAWTEKTFKNMGSNDETTFSTEHSEIVPQRFTRELPNQDLLTTNVSLMFGSYFRHGTRYKYINREIPKLNLIKEKIKNGKVEGGGEMATSGVLEMLNKHMSIHVYGNLIDETESITSFFNTIFRTDNISGAKIIKATQGYIRDTNLALNPVTPVVGAITSTLDNIKFTLADNLVDKNRLGFINKETGKMYASHLRDIGSNKPTTFAKKLMEFAGLNISADELIDGMAKSKVFRMMNNPTMGAYANAGVQSGLLAIVAMYDGHRLIGDKFYNINQWREKNVGKSKEEIDTTWKEAEKNSYYNFLKRDGQKVEIDKVRLKASGFNGSIGELQERMMTVSDIYWNRIEAQAVATDRPHLASSPIMGFVMTHSMWFFNYFNTGFRKKQYNIEEYRWEEGRYQTIGRMFSNFTKDPNMSLMDKAEIASKMMGSLITMGYYAKGIEGLEEFEKTNIKQLGAQLNVYLLGTLAFLLMNLSADDDEDNALKQYLAFVASRALNEQASQTAPVSLRGILDKIKSPVPGHRYMEQLWSLPLMLSPKGGDIVKSGTYKGMSKRGAAILKFSILKNGMYTFDTAYKFRQNNLYFRSSLFSAENQILDYWRDEE